MYVLSINNLKLFTSREEILEGFDDLFLKIGSNLADKIRTTESQFKFTLYYPSYLALRQQSG